MIAKDRHAYSDCLALARAPNSMTFYPYHPIL
jgi:hypothetical protein